MEDRVQLRCDGCCYLVLTEDDTWGCDCYGKEIYDVSFEDCED